MIPPAKAYKINRLDDSADGYHYRTRTSLQGHLDRAPYPPAQGNKRQPKVYRNQDNPQIFRRVPPGTTLYEYPSKPYPYHEQNAQGIAWVRDAQGNITKDARGRNVRVDPEYTRTFTDQNKKFKKVGYHPHGNTRAFVEAQPVRVPASAVKRHPKR